MTRGKALTININNIFLGFFTSFNNQKGSTGIIYAMIGLVMLLSTWTRIMLMFGRTIKTIMNGTRMGASVIFGTCEVVEVIPMTEMSEDEVGHSEELFDLYCIEEAADVNRVKFNPPANFIEIDYAEVVQYRPPVGNYVAYHSMYYNGTIAAPAAPRRNRRPHYIF